MRRQATVIDRVGDMVQVQFERSQSCKHCHACAGQECRAMLHAPRTLNKGDTVDVEVPDTRIVQLSAMTYGLPLVSLMAGVLAGSGLYPLLNIAMNAEMFSALTGGVFMLLGLLALHMLDNKWAFRSEFQPRIVEGAPVLTPAPDAYAASRAENGLGKGEA